MQLYLRSLRSALAATDNQSAIPAELESVNEGLEPFAELDFAQFAAFLQQSERYRATGAVSSNADAERAKAGLRSLATLSDRLSGKNALDALELQRERALARQELEQALVPFLKALAIDVTLKDNPKAFESLLLRIRMRPTAADVRHVLEGVTDTASLNLPERQEKLARLLDPLDVPQLHALATELGVKTTARAKKDALHQLIVAGVTGIKAGAGKATSRTRATAVDAAVIHQHAVHLKGLLEKSVDPDGLSDAEVASAIAKLGELREVDLQAVVHEAGLENVGKKKADMLKKIGLKLTEARRAAESIQV